MDAHPLALARAFHDDPAVCYLLPKPKRRERAMAFSFACYLRYGRRFGQVDTSPAGAAIWLHEDAAYPSLAKLLGCGFAPAPFKLVVPAFSRMYRFDNATHALHERALSGAHLYLFILGAYRQGRDEGRRLLRPGLDRADRSGLPCYLETTAPRALPFYAQHGFNVVAEADVPGGPHLWGSLRPTSPGHGAF